MKAYNFSLEKMYKYKEQVFKREKSLLAQLQKKRDDIINNIENLQQEQIQVRETMNEKSSQGMTVMEMQPYKYMIESAVQKIKDLRRQLVLAEQEVEKQLEVVKAIAIEISGLEKLEEKQRSNYDEKLAKEGREELLEFVSLKLHNNNDVNFERR